MATMGKRNKKKQFIEFSPQDNFGSSLRGERRNYDSNRFGRSNYYKYDKHSFHSFKHKKDYNFYKKKSKRHPSRPQSPVLGTQEYMEKKIEQTSAIIMRQLLNPNETTPVTITSQNKNNQNDLIVNSATDLPKSIDLQTVNSNNKTKKKLSSQEVEEIHTKIMCHLTNLNYGRKRNLINANNSGYDTTIQHFVKQQRLEISRALRTMCTSNHMEEQNELISSVIPDIGIKLEELPKDVIEELSHTFGCDFNVDFSLDNYENYSFLTNDINSAPEPERFEINRADVFVGQQMDFSLNVSSDNISIKEEKKDDNDVVVVEDVEEVIEINDDEEVNESDEVKKVKNIGEVSIELMKDGQDLKPPPKMVDLLLITPESDEIGVRIDERIDEVNKKDEVDGNFKEENFVENNAKDEFEETDSVIVKTEVDDNVDSVIDQNYKNEGIDQNIVSEELKPILDAKEEKCTIAVKELEEEPLEQIIKKENSSTQTDFEEKPLTLDLLIEKNFGKKPVNLSDAVARMIMIDEWVSKLTAFRQDMFREFTSAAIEESGILNSKNIDGAVEKVIKKRKVVSDEIATNDDDNNAGMEVPEDCVEEITYDDIDDSSTRECLMHFEDIDDIISVIKIFEDKLIAGSDSGTIYIFSITDGTFLQILPIHSGVPITSLLLIEEGLCSRNMYIGTFRDHLHVYSLDSYHHLKSITVPDSVQCMDNRWGYIFIGCFGGWLLRYSIERENVEYDEKFNDGTIVALKATVEGPRRILLVATEESPLCIRDAMTGLHLRVIAKLDTYNVYSIIADGHLIYCGTNKGDLLILSFHKGIMLQTEKIPGALGKVCMKLYRNVLFISRKKDIHLYDLKAKKFIGEIKGPGGGILSMEIVRNQLILGTNERKFIAIRIDWNSFKNR